MNPPVNQRVRAQAGHRRMPLRLRSTVPHLPSLKTLNALLKINPGLYDVHQNMGLAYKSMGDITNAEKKFKDAIRIKFKAPEAHYNLASLYGNLGKAIQASEEFDISEKLYKEHSECKECPVYKTDMVTASMVKYCINGLLATKVTFMNEMYDILKAAKGTDWKTFTDIISNDPRVGKTHMKVPGNDGQRGYAGSCFPKDTNALAWFAREILNTPFTQLETSIKINDTLRKRNQS